MALDLPTTEQQVVDETRSDIQAALPGSNPFLSNSWTNAIATGFSGRIFDFYRQMAVNDLERFPNTASNGFLEDFWGPLKNISRNAATGSVGNVIATGTAGSIIATGAQLQSSSGEAYTTTSDATIANNLVSVTSLTRVGTTVTGQTSAAHNMFTGQTVLIANADQPEYNGSVTVIVTSPTEFTYTIVGSPVTPATGSITAAYTSASVPVESTGSGSGTNQDNGAALSFTGIISGVNSTAYVGANGLTGGTDIENDEDYRDRILEAYQNPVAHFNVAAIEAEAKKVAGVTRVFVQEITPAVGQVTVYFVRDNDDSIIPSAAEVTAVKNQILTIKPANTSSSDVIVSSPTAKTVNFNFSSIVPNSSSMQASIQANLTQFFAENTGINEDVLQDGYRSAIYNTVDTTTGERLQSFSLSAPVGDVTVAASEIGVLGTVTF